jgi:prevent-host-death family protein
MLIVKAKEAQARLGEIISKVSKEPVAISRHGKTTAVVVSYDDFKRFEELEDFYWFSKAKEAEMDGFLSSEESEALLNNILKGGLSENNAK